MAAIGRALLLALAAVALLALPAAASAAVKVNTLTGTFKPESVAGKGTVIVKVVVKNGNPVRIKSVVFKNLPARCNVGETPGSPVYQPAGKMSGSGGKNLDDAIDFGRRVTWISYPSAGKRQVTMNGRLNKAGTVLFKGELQVHNNAPGACQSAVGKFTATR